MACSQLRKPSSQSFEVEQAFNLPLSSQMWEFQQCVYAQTHCFSTCSCQDLTYGKCPPQEGITLKRTFRCWSVSSDGQQSWLKGVANVLYEEQLGKLGLFSLKNRRLGGTLSFYSSLKGRCQVGAGLSYGACRTTGNGLKLRQRRLRLHIIKFFPIIRVVKHWNRLPKEVIESP